jgi:nicotinamide-nucleotide amidase
MTRPGVAILVTGEEILQGRVQERNAGHLAEDLATRGLSPTRIVVVGDGAEVIRDALRDLLGSGAGLVIVSGGLGPTHDDRTMEAVAAAVGRPLVLDPRALALVQQGRVGIRAIERIGNDARRLVEEKQAMFPEGADVVPPAGTAPGAVLRHGNAVIVVLPGPPWELADMWGRVVSGFPVVSKLLAPVPGESRRLFRLHGVVESEVAGEVALLPPEVRDGLELGICARSAELEVSARGPAAVVQAVEDALARRFDDRLYSRDGSSALQQVAATLLARGEKMAVAESCTGGLLGALITAEDGSSTWFLGGVVAYDNAVKERLLGVDPDTIALFGAVSPECAREMAEGALRATGAGWALSVTGIAGPGGGSAEKPVGLVYLGVAGDGVSEVMERRFRGDRDRVRQGAAGTAIHLLRRVLQSRHSDARKS